MSLPLLKRLVRLMAANDLTNVELQDGDQRITLSRGGHGGAGQAPMMYAPMSGGAQQAPFSMPTSPSGTAGPATSLPPAASAGGAGTVGIKSPMVGTFYVSPSPDAKPFVQVGDRVGPDTDVCIIEAMKVFNNIKAETSGTIEKCLVENGQAVEYGQALFLVRPA